VFVCTLYNKLPSDTGKFTQFTLDNTLQLELEAAFQSNIANTFICTKGDECEQCSESNSRYCTHFNMCQIPSLNKFWNPDGVPIPEWDDRQGLNNLTDNAMIYFTKFINYYWCLLRY
jgi:hypothetical protein